MSSPRLRSSRRGSVRRLDGTIRTKSFTLDRDAYLKAIWGRGLRPRLIAVVIMILIYAGLAAWFGGVWAAVGAIVGGAVVLPILLGIRYLVTRRKFRSRDLAVLFDDPRTMLFAYDGVMTRTQGGIESRVPWTQIKKIERRSGFMLLLITKDQFLVIPENAFATEGDRRALDDLMRARELPGA